MKQFTVAEVAATIDHAILEPNFTHANIVAVTTFLCSEGADYMTGQAITITGGREMH